MTDKHSTGSFQMIMGFMRSYPWRSVALLICLLFAGISEGLGIATLLPLLNLAMDGKDASSSSLSEAVSEAFAAVGLEPSVGLLLLLIFIGILLKSGFMLFAMKQVGYTLAHLVTELRLSLVRALLEARWDYSLSKPVGLFTNAVSSEAMRMSRGYQLACMILAGAIQVLFYLIVALLISWQVTVLSLVIGFLIMFLLRPLVGMARRSGVKQTETLRSLIVHLTDLLNGLKPIKAMSREKQVEKLLETESKRLKKALQEKVLSSEMLSILQEPMIVFFLLVGFYFVLVKSTVPMTDLLVMAFLFYRSVGRMGTIQKQFQTMAVCESAYWSFLNTLNQVESAKEVVLGTFYPKLHNCISFQDVSFSYRKIKILKKASFQIPFGKIAVFTGLSGAGKTTIADLLTGLIKPEAGEIFVDGTAMAKVDIRAWRRMIGYVPQEMFLFHESVFANVALGNNKLTREDVEDALRKAGAWDFVVALPHGMDAIVGERGSKISGGQRQRVALARALAGKPKLLILDEVTTALDPETEAAICTTMAGLREEMAIFAISHQRALIDAADLVYEVKDGTVSPIGHG